MHTEYLEAGFRVFGLWAVVNGKCGCGNPECKSIYKHPRVSNWQKTPHWSAEQIEVMEESGQFDTGFGVLVNDHLIVDVDPRNGGFESYKQMCTDLGFELIKECGFYVETGGGGWHIYYKLSDSKALKGKLKEYPGIDFKSSGFVVGYGSHHSSGTPYQIGKGQLDSIGAPPEALIALLDRPEHFRTEYNGQTIETSIDEIKALLAVIDPDCDYDTWRTCGMAVHDATEASAEGFQAWDEWSKAGKKYPGTAALDNKWHSFGKTQQTPVSFGTLKHIAQENGYQEAVTFEYEPEINSGFITTDHIDICRPPGFVGELTGWINSQCRYPREKLAAAAALMVVSNLAGNKFNDVSYGASANLFMFCVAGSATGKEAILQAMSDILVSAGLGRSIHGSIKSEQEIVRSLVEDPKCIYLIDEIGFLLRKLANAQTKGTAVYLEGVIGLLMAAYSKAHSKMFLGRDVKEGATKALRAEIAALNKCKEENENYNEQRLSQAIKFLADVENGYIDQPFLSLTGFTTPTMFYESVSAENATNGFIGRSLIVEEKNTNPRMKKKYAPKAMPLGLSIRAASISNGEAIPLDIQTTKAGSELLERVQEELYGVAESQLKNGLEAVARRGFELVLKVSLICAIPDGVRDVHHIEYAYEFVRRDLEHKINLAASNSAEAHKAKDEELMRKIIGQVDTKEPTSIGVIHNRLRKFKKDDINKALDKLESLEVIMRESSQGARGPRSVNYYLVDSAFMLN